MQIQEQEKISYYLISIDGILTISEITALKNTILAAMSTGHDKIAIEMSNITHIDSSGIGLLLNVSKKLKKTEGHLALVSVTEEIMELLSITLPLDQFDVFSSIPELEKAYK